MLLSKEGLTGLIEVNPDANREVKKKGGMFFIQTQTSPSKDY